MPQEADGCTRHGLLPRTWTSGKRLLPPRVLGPPCAVFAPTGQHPCLLGGKDGSSQQNLPCGECSPRDSSGGAVLRSAPRGWGWGCGEHGPCPHPRDGACSRETGARFRDADTSGPHQVPLPRTPAALLWPPGGPQGGGHTRPPAQTRALSLTGCWTRNTCGVGRADRWLPATAPGWEPLKRPGEVAQGRTGHRSCPSAPTTDASASGPSTRRHLNPPRAPDTATASAHVYKTRNAERRMFPLRSLRERASVQGPRSGLRVAWGPRGVSQAWPLGADGRGSGGPRLGIFQIMGATWGGLPSCTGV